MSPPNSGRAAEPAPHEFVIGNEFAHVVVRKVYTRNGERLEIESPFFGSAIRLDALHLEGISWQETEVLSQFLKGVNATVVREATIQR